METKDVSWTMGTRRRRKRRRTKTGRMKEAGNQVLKIRPGMENFHWR